jgi:hypothetical protein
MYIMNRALRGALILARGGLDAARQLREYVKANSHNLAMLRFHAGISQEELAKRACTVQPCISAIEHGSLAHISDVTLVRILEAYSNLEPQ